MDADKVAARIAARKALGMTAAEYNALQEKLARDLAGARRDAIAEAVRAGMRGSEQEIDAALARCRLLGC